MLAKILLIAVLCSLASAYWSSGASHAFSPSVSGQLAEAIRQKLLSIPANSYVEPNFGEQFVADLRETDDSKRKLTSLSTVSASQIFGIFSLDMPSDCDKNGDDLISGDELRCLNKIWKYFVPK